MVKGRAVWSACILVMAAVAWCVGAGCSGSDRRDPSSPSLSSPAVSVESGTHHRLLGLWEVRLDTENLTVEMTPLRSAGFHVNLVEPLNAYHSVGVWFDWLASDIPNKIFALDFTFTHPYPDSLSLYGFDAKGILITPGSLQIGNLVVADVDEWRLLNADGYTRWWNPKEFTGSDLNGYVPGELGTQDTGLLTATVNPYKYFCDYLDKYQPVTSMANVPLDDDMGRGVSYVGTTCTRRFRVKLPEAVDCPAVFNYAVDACWDYPDPFPPQEIPDDFPIEANQSEPYHVDAHVELNTLCFQEGVGGQGQLVVNADVYDWQGKASGNIAAEVDAVRIFAPELFSGGKTMDFVSDDGTKARYRIDLTGQAIPNHDGDHLVLIRVGSNDGLKYNTGLPEAPNEPVSVFQELIIDVPKLECVADDNNGIDDAEAMEWMDVAQGSLCRLGGNLTDYKDYYSFQNGSEVWQQGMVNLYTTSPQTFVTIYDPSETKIAQAEVIGGVASVDTSLVCGIGQYFIRVITLNETEMVQYQLELVPHVQPEPPVITEGISGPLYPRNKHEVTYQVTVDSVLPVKYSWKVEHPEGILTVDLGEGNKDGTIDVIFSSTGIQEGEWLIKCKVDDGHNASVNAQPYSVWVNGQIFHASMNDAHVGDNGGWATLEGEGPSRWTDEAVTDDTLEGTGRKFGAANADYDYGSSDILVSPSIHLPSAMTQGIVVFRHSFDFGQIYGTASPDYWQAYSGGNIKITEAGQILSHGITPANIKAGREYWAKPIYEGTQNKLLNQDVFSGTHHTLTTSVARIDPLLAGHDIRVSFAASSAFSGDFPNARGWMVDDVSVYILDDQPNDPPTVGEIEGGNLTPGWSQQVTLQLPAEDPDGDRIYYQWYLWDYRSPGRRVEDVYYGDVSGDSISFKVEDIVDSDLGYLDENVNRYWIPVMAQDAFHVPEVRSEWCVGGGTLFHADWEASATDYDRYDWIKDFDSGGSSTWYVGWHQNPNLVGRGPMFSGSTYEYDLLTHSVLFSPPIFVPPGFTTLQLVFTHSYEFDDYGLTGFCQDGGNVHVVNGKDYLTDFQWGELPADLEWGFNEYDCVILGNNELIGMPAFCNDSNPKFMRLSVCNLDPAWVGNPDGFRLAFAAAVGSMGAARAGWQIDEVYVSGY